MFGREPCHVRLCEYGIEHHQPFDGPAQRHRSAMAIVRFADRVVQALRVDVIHTRASAPTRIAGGVTLGHQVMKEVAGHLAMHQARRHAILPFDADAGVQHHGDEEGRLTLGESETGEALHAIREGHSRSPSATPGSKARPPRRPPLPEPPTRAPAAWYWLNPERPFAAACAPR